MTVSILGPGGYPRAPYGSFSGKPSAAGGSKVYTRTFSLLGAGGYPRPPYGSFAAKTASTTHTNSGIARLRSAAWAAEQQKQAEWAEVARKQALQVQSILRGEKRKAERAEIQRKAEIAATELLASAPAVEPRTVQRARAGEITAVEAVAAIRRAVATERVLAARISAEAEEAAVVLREADDEAALIVMMLGS